MSLQRKHDWRGSNTKGTRFAFRSLAAFLAALSLFSLAACANTDASRMETPTVSAEPSTTIEESTITLPGLDEEANDIIEKYKEMENSPNYYLDYYKTITDEDVQELVDRMGIIFPDMEMPLEYSRAVVIKDVDGTIKPIDAIEVYVGAKKRCDVYAMNGIKLFDYPDFTFDIDYENAIVRNFDFDRISNRNTYFDNPQVEILGYGIPGFSIAFLDEYKDDIKSQSPVNYRINTWDAYIEAFEGCSYFDKNGAFYIRYDDTRSFKEIAEKYARYTPLKHQFDISVLLRDYEFKPERKYVDCWNVSEEELETRMESIGVSDLETEFPMSAVQTLVFEDGAGKLWPRYVLMSTDRQKNRVRIIDFATRLELFAITGVQSYRLNHDTRVFEGINYDNIEDAIPFFQDKKIIKICAYHGIPDFYVENMDYFRERDTIGYEDVSSFVQFVSRPRGSYDTDDMYLPTSYYMRRYSSIPKEDIITLDQLTVGLDIDFEKLK